MTTQREKDLDAAYGHPMYIQDPDSFADGAEYGRKDLARRVLGAMGHPQIVKVLVKVLKLCYAILDRKKEEESC